MRSRLATLWLPLLFFALFLLFPFYWMVLTAFRPNEDLVSTAVNPFIVHRPTLAHVQYLLQGTSFPRWFWNTMGIATGASVLSVATSWLAAYGIVRVGFRGSTAAGLAIYLGYLVPPAILFIPLADILLRLGWFQSF